jgi:hypothetical protein
MTVYFLDTGALVKRDHREQGSEVIDALFVQQGRRIIISDLSIIEFGSALSKKVREGEITPEKDHRLWLFLPRPRDRNHLCENIGRRG